MSNWSNFPGQEKREFLNISEATGIKRDIFTMINLFERSDSGSWAHREWSNKIIYNNRLLNSSVVNGHSCKFFWCWRRCRVLQVRKGFGFWRVVCLYPVYDIVSED